MKKSTVTYSILGSESLLNEIIHDEIMRENLTKKYNLSGEQTNFGGFMIYKHIMFGYSKPSINPFIKLHIKIVNIDKKGLKCRVILKRVNDEPYEVHRAIAIVLGVVMAIIASHQILSYGFMEDIVFSILPIFGIGYYLVVELLAKMSFKSLCKSVEEIMKTEGLVYNNTTR